MLINKRKLNRLKGWDYSEGWYFVTINVHYHGEIFGKVINEKMIINEHGKLIWSQWSWMIDHFGVWGDEFIVMPDHIHGIIYFPRVRTGLDLSVQKRNNLSKVVGAFKTTSSKMIHQNGLEEFLWQRSFFDEIIRSRRQYLNIRKYIRDNPKNWNRRS